MAITSPLSAESDGADEYQPKRGAAAGKTTKKVPKTTSKTDKNNTNNKTELQHVEDDVYTPQDAVALQNVHRLIDVSPETRKEWGVPEVSLISKLCVRVCLCVCVFLEGYYFGVIPFLNKLGKNGLISMAPHNF
jgi:hypothetical protein